jgi:1-acyl-sn-glycerol-3-phosphate acyltransferase
MLFLRSVAFNLFLYAFTALCTLLAVSAAIVWPSRLWSVARLWSRGWLRAYETICGVSYHVKGVENVPRDGACIIAMKHQSTWDTFALYAIFEHPVFVLKSELMWIPLFGMALKRLGCIAVKRGTGKAALESMIAGARTASDLGRQIVIFPEGTRSEAGAPGDYKSGVSHLYVQLGVPCVPAALNSGLFWPRRSLLRPAGVITVDILPAIPPGLPRREMFGRMTQAIETSSQVLAGGTTR